MDQPTSIDNRYAAPTADDAVLDQASREPAPRLAVAFWLTGMAVCGVIFAVDRLLAFKIPSEAFPAVFSVGVCLGSLGAVGMRRRWFVTLGLVFMFFVAIFVEILVVATIEMMLKGIGRFG